MQIKLIQVSVQTNTLQLTLFLKMKKRKLKENSKIDRLFDDTSSSKKGKEKKKKKRERQREWRKVEKMIIYPGSKYDNNVLHITFLLI